ncbi:MAG TPA: S8 family serine peptidase [Firmicutes bacterium]|nr:S8 family serine peptidase [Bacillota bacterium]
MRAMQRYLVPVLVVLLVGACLSCYSGGRATAAQAVELAYPGKLARISAGESVPVERASSLFEHNLEALGLAELGLSEGNRGAGTVVAIVDTGVDPSHPALGRSPSGDYKIVDWIDLTGEGRVDTSTVAGARWGRLHTEFGVVKLGKVLSLSGQYHYGVFRENQIPRQAPVMTKFQGTSGDGWFLVVVVDSKKAGVYDTVIVDANGNMDLSDDVPLTKFSAGHSFASFSKAGTRLGAARLPFVVSNVSTDGKKVVLGFDANGHGTMVAGIAAGYDGERYSGVAPAASVIVIKALGSDGNGSMDRVLKGVRLAGARGADVVNLSVANTGEVLMENLDEEGVDEEPGAGPGVSGSLVVAAVGNGGPGLGSARLPSDFGNMGIFASAGYTPDLLEAYGVGSARRPGIFVFSAVGPSAENGLVPSVVAPGIASGPVPKWLSASGYSIGEGTSIASAHTAGVALVVLGAVRQRGMEASPVALRGMLLAGTHPEEGYSPVEQGYGFLDARGAVGLIERAKTRAGEIRVLTLDGNPPAYYYGGLYERDVAPGLSVHAVDNFGGEPIELEWDGTEAWVRPEEKRVAIPAVKEREVRFRYEKPAGTGLHSALVVGRDTASGLPVVEIPVTSVQGAGFGPRANAVLWRGELDSGRWQRHYVKVPEGATSLELTLSAMQSAEPGAIAMAYVISPGGQRSITGVAQARLSEATVAEFSTDTPEPGLWEVVVYAPIAGGGVKPASVKYELDVVCKGVFMANVSRTAEGLSRVIVQNSVGPLQAQAVVAVRKPEGYRGEGLIRQISQGESLMYPLPEAKSGTVALFVEIQPVGDEAMGSADLDLFVFRYDQEARQWSEVGQSAHKGSSAESVRLLYPQPGEYVAYVECGGGSAGAVRTAQFKLVSQRLDKDSGTDLVAVHGAKLSEWKLGEEALIDISGQAGDTFLLLVQKEPASIIASLPVSGADRTGAVAWTVTSGPLITGQKNQVTIRFWESGRALPLRGGVILDGLYYPLVDGKITLELTPSSEEVVLNGTALWSSGRQALTVKLYAVKPESGLIPLPGPGANSDYILRKIASQVR